MRKYYLIGLLALIVIGCGVNTSNNESSGIIVNVAQSGAHHATWDLWLLHGNSQMAEKTSEEFSLDPSKPELVKIAQDFSMSGQRVKLIYDHKNNLWTCLYWSWSALNNCDMVTEIIPVQ